MMRFALRHRTTRRYLSSHPAFNIFRDSPVESEAVTWSTEEEAGLYRADFGDFAEAWEVVPVDVASIYDNPDETISQAGERER